MRFTLVGLHLVRVLVFLLLLGLECSLEFFWAGGKCCFKKGKKEGKKY